LTTIAAVVLLSGCGGGSGGKSAGTVGGSRVVSAREGAFRTVVPVGFHYSGSQTQFNTEGVGVNAGMALVVIREPVRVVGGIKASARRTLSGARHETGVHRLSGLTALSVGGEPALAEGYAGTEKGKEWNFHQVLVRHGPWVYFIREAWSAGQHAAAVAALKEVLSNWQWQ
jgi:hypothetical protein